MRRFKDILVVVDDLTTSQRAVDAAALLGARNGAKLTIVGLVEMSAANQVVKLSDGREVEIAGLLADERRRELEEVAARLELPDVETDVIAGVGFVEIIKRIQRNGHDIVFCSPAEESSHGLAGSSLVMHLLRKSPVPVWVETPRGDPSPDVAVALGPFGTDDQRLNQRLVELAGSLAAIRQGTLHLIHAWRLEGETLLRRSRVRRPAAQVDELVEAVRLEASANMEYFSGRAEPYGVPYEVHLERGRPGTVIPQTIAEIRPGVVVLGTLARTGLQGMFMGSTAEQVLSEVESSVLAAKPDDFISPIPPD
jgi:nucleotide-binding universal stress UspA family protein